MAELTDAEYAQRLRAIVDFHRPASEWTGALSDDDIALMYAIAARLDSRDQPAARDGVEDHPTCDRAIANPGPSSS